MERRIGLAGACLALVLSLCACAPQEAVSPTVPPTPSPAQPAIPTPTPTLSPAPTPSPTPGPELEYLPRDTIRAPIDYPLSGELWRYNSLEEDGWLFEWIMSDETITATDADRIWEQKLLISRVTDSGPVFVQKLDVENEWLEFAMMPGLGTLRYTDVDFDGEKDLLLCLGSFGTQGLLRFSAFLQREGGFEECASFSDIPNPAIDQENQFILGQWRNMAVSHGWGIYEYRDGEFIALRVLTEEPVPGSSGEDGELVWQWTVTESGETTVLARSDELTEEEIDDLLFNENSEWDLTSTRWWGTDANND